MTGLVQRYCERHGGGSASAQRDGGWRCTRFLSSSTVEMDVACQEAYEPDAFARTSDAGDPYAWRCYR
ncbi:hypothetical protein K7640_08070 [Micromonospora sp. PLK6-60]|uniref:hypothetical protein n=1 Tax=Micromonospora sp. PLK6-60 TaxID=2873383 RepID=UPI001CA6A4C5|nr:hypothetical protein [Micromonospora sp. PLK6-60]MBY8871795.1 hypothetical protein [Micromonospora sp. PLK6-60]